MVLIRALGMSGKLDVTIENGHRDVAPLQAFRSEPGEQTLCRTWLATFELSSIVGRMQELYL